MADLNEMKIKDVSLDTLKEYINQQEFPDYTVRYRSDVEYDHTELQYSNGASFDAYANGVSIDVKFVDEVVVLDGEITIRLKGTTKYGGVVLWKNQNE